MNDDESSQECGTQVHMYWVVNDEWSQEHGTQVHMYWVVVFKDFYLIVFTTGCFHINAQLVHGQYRFNILSCTFPNAE